MRDQPTGRFAAHLDGDFVVFLIGMRLNRMWQVTAWWPIFRAMPRLLSTLSADPDSGFLGAQRAYIGGPAVVQYWRSLDDLIRFARTGPGHLSIWRWFNTQVKDSGAVGIWHETYQVRDGAYESIYGNMPAFGLAAASSRVPVVLKGRSAARRIGVSLVDQPLPGGITEYE